LISSLTALFIIFAAVIGSTALVSVLAYLLHRLRRIEAGSAGEAGSDHMLGQVNRIQEELLTIQDELASLSERLDFTERLLMRGDESAAPGDPK
jgi:hypothetical protein